jgi:uncharacterized membrane protein
MTMTIRNPIEWSADQFRLAAHIIEEASHTIYHPGEDVDALRPAVQRIAASDLKEALTKGFADFGAYRSDVVFLCALYPIIGIIIERAALGDDMLPLLFPIASGFALIGPFVATGLYEMSRRRELGKEISWADAFGVFHSPAFGAISALGLCLIATYVTWLIAAENIYLITLGPRPPGSLMVFAQAVFTTPAGWEMISLGVVSGFLFAVLAMVISVVAFPLLLDRNVGLDTAVWTSIRAVRMNIAPMAMWGAIVTAALIIGSIPLFLGLAIVLPVLGHATWHLYRKLIPH